MKLSATRGDTEVRSLLSTLWIFYLLNMVFRDIHEFLRPGFLQEVMTGTLNGTVLTDELFLLSGLMLEIPLAMVLFSRVLSHGWARWMNIFAAAAAISLVWVGRPADMDDFLFAVVEVAALVAIIGLAWRWRVAAVTHTAERLA